MSKHRYTGVCKWFNPDKGFGFLTPDGGGTDIFVHITAVQKAGMEGLEKDQRVAFDLEEDRGKTKAVNLSKAA